MTFVWATKTTTKRNAVSQMPNEQSGCCKNDSSALPYCAVVSTAATAAAAAAAA